MSTYTLKSLGNDYLEDSSILPESSVPAEQDQSSFKLVGLKDQNAAKQSMLRISHKRHADPSTRIDTKSRVMGTMSPAVAPEAAKEQPEERAAAGQRMGENRDPADRLPNETWANRRNPVTGQGLTPAEPMHGGRTHNMRKQVFYHVHHVSGIASSMDLLSLSPPDSVHESEAAFQTQAYAFFQSSTRWPHLTPCTHPHSDPLFPTK